MTVYNNILSYILHHIITQITTSMEYIHTAMRTGVYQENYQNQTISKSQERDKIMQ